MPFRLACGGLPDTVDCVTAQTLKEQASPEAALTAFYAQHETPDLIWSPSTRARLSAAVLEEWNAWTTANRDAGAMTPWTPRSVDPATGVRYAPAELRVAGLYVRLFNAQPGYAARMQQQHRVRFIHGLLSELAGAYVCVCVGNAGQSTREVSHVLVQVPQATPHAMCWWRHCTQQL